jgi:hypothetical protein
MRCHFSYAISHSYTSFQSETPFLIYRQGHSHPSPGFPLKTCGNDITFFSVIPECFCRESRLVESLDLDALLELCKKNVFLLESFLFRAQYIAPLQKRPPRAITVSQSHNLIFSNLHFLLILSYLSTFCNYENKTSLHYAFVLLRRLCSGFQRERRF